MKQYFENLANEIDILLKSDKVDEIKTFMATKFITIIDFIYYDTEINGVKFKELTKETQEKIIEMTKKIDSSIMKHDPNYKDSLKDNYKTVTSYLNGKTSEIVNYTKEKIGLDNYNTVKEATNEIKGTIKNTAVSIGDASSELYKKSKKQVNNWYGNLKDKYKKEN